jgi:hypothetical protein
MSPSTFSSNVLSYTFTMPAGSGFTANAVPSSGDAYLTVGGVRVRNGVDSAVTYPAVGSVVTIVCTAPSGASTTYSFTIAQPPSKDSSLVKLSVSGVALSTPFSSANYLYSGRVTSSVSSVEINATANHPAAVVIFRSITYGQSLILSSPQTNLIYGSLTSFILICKSQAGTNTTYQIDITQELCKYICSCPYVHLSVLPSSLYDCKLACCLYFFSLPFPCLSN